MHINSLGNLTQRHWPSLNISSKNTHLETFLFSVNLIQTNFSFRIFHKENFASHMLITPKEFQPKPTWSTFREELITLKLTNTYMNFTMLFKDIKQIDVNLKSISTSLLLLNLAAFILHHTNNVCYTMWKTLGLLGGAKCISYTVHPL